MLMPCDLTTSTCLPLKLQCLSLQKALNRVEFRKPSQRVRDVRVGRRNLKKGQERGDGALLEVVSILAPEGCFSYSD